MIEGTTLDLALHLATLVVALALFGVSYSAYRKKENTKFLYVCSAFGVFALKEGVIAADTLGYGTGFLVGISHVLNLVILGLFFRGTVK